jgi:hypothetical protein
MRPAVDLIARLAAERARLRDDLQRLRDDVTSVEPQAQRDPASELDAVKAELARMTAERDALRREVEQLRGARTQDPFDGLLERLERVAGRLELSTSSSAARRRPASGRVSREAVPTPRSTPRSSTRSGPGPAPAAPPSQGGGMLGSLVAQNLMLRPGSDRAQRAGSTPTSTPRPAAAAPQRTTPAPQPRPSSGGGGLLAGLVKQNLAVRSTPQGQRRAHAA